MSYNWDGIFFSKAIRNTKLEEILQVSLIYSIANLGFVIEYSLTQYSTPNIVDAKLAVVLILTYRSDPQTYSLSSAK